MEQYILFEGEEHKVFTLHAFGREFRVIVVKRQYGNGSLALSVLACKPDKNNTLIPVEPFGILTVNLGCKSKLCQFIKNYSENQEWAEELAKAIGGKDTGIKQKTGMVEVPFYDFSNLKICKEDESK